MIQVIDGDVWINLRLFCNLLPILRGASLHVFIAICRHIDPSGFAFPSYNRLQTLTGLSRTAVARAISNLCQTRIDDNPVLLRTTNDSGYNEYNVSAVMIGSVLLPTSSETLPIQGDQASSETLPTSNDTLPTSNGTLPKLVAKRYPNNYYKSHKEEEEEEDQTTTEDDNSDRKYQPNPAIKAREYPAETRLAARQAVFAAARDDPDPTPTTNGKGPQNAVQPVSAGQRAWEKLYRGLEISLPRATFEQWVYGARFLSQDGDTVWVKVAEHQVDFCRTRLPKARAWQSRIVHDAPGLHFEFTSQGETA